MKNVRLPPSLITAAAFVSLLEADKRNTATQTALCAQSTGGRAAEALPLTVRLFLKRGGRGFYFFICRGWDWGVSSPLISVSFSCLCSVTMAPWTEVSSRTKRQISPGDASLFPVKPNLMLCATEPMIRGVCEGARGGEWYVSAHLVA